MRIRVLGCGWYGAHLGLSFLNEGHEVEIHESADRIFAGASGSNPARLHLGFHYPRSRLTRAFCQDHNARFMETYGSLTCPVPVNIYAVAARDSTVDFGTYLQILRAETDLIPVYDPSEFGLNKIEGAVLTGERHVVIRKATEYFTAALGSVIRLNTPADAGDGASWDWTLDCTFCALEPVDVDRYEPCVTGILKGPADWAVTVMDGPFPSVYPWDEDWGLSTVTSAKYTPLAKCSTWNEAKSVLDALSSNDARRRVNAMIDQVSEYWPAVLERYAVEGWKLGIRAMPRSAADARVVDAARVGERTIRLRAGKIDAVFQAEAVVRQMMEDA